MDSDVIVVMEDGRCAESGPPRELISRPDSKFAALVKADRAYGKAAPPTTPSAGDQKQAEEGVVSPTAAGH